MKDVTAVGDEGGFAPNSLGGDEDAIELILKAIRTAGYEPGKDFVLAMDAASSEWKSEKGKGFYALDVLQHLFHQLFVGGDLPARQFPGGGLQVPVHQQEHAEANEQHQRRAPVEQRQHGDDQQPSITLDLILTLSILSIIIGG